MDSAWAEFQARPSKITYKELLRHVPKSERGSWHERAIAAAERGDLASLIELWIAVKETEQLAERLARAGDRELEELSHFVTEPVRAGRLSFDNSSYASPKLYPAAFPLVLTSRSPLT